MKRIIKLLLIIIVSYSGISQEKISGIINTYGSVTSINENKSELEIADINAMNLLPDDLILVIQMKGAMISWSNNVTFGKILDIKNCGNYELATVKEINGNKIKLKTPLCKDFDVDGIVQIIKTPVYKNAEINGYLSCQDWDGAKGGVLSMYVENNLLINANVYVSGKGFKGGEVVNTSWCCDFKDYFYPIGTFKGAAKGEGIIDLPQTHTAGRGPAANGGGGGNSTNSGGAGGGNFNEGGKGGYQFIDGCVTADIGGIGGVGLKNFYLDKVFLGGGGGAGHENDNAGSSGGNGGGIVIIFANKVLGQGKIYANGEDAKASANDGAGGGGAGGTVLLFVNKFEDSLEISVKGGDGGDCSVGPYKHCYGPGGGGSGGIIWFSSDQIPTNLNLNIKGGKNGIITNPQSPCYNSNYGAEQGKDGVVWTNLKLTSCCDETSFNYPDFSSIDGLNFVGQAYKLQKKIVLTPSSQWKGGAVWHDAKVPVKKGFSTEFSFRFTNGVNKYEPETYEGADGITFVIQNNNSKALGALGGGLGFSGIENSFAIEFDTYKNYQNVLMQTNLNDPSENHLGIFCNGTYPNESAHGGDADLFTLDLIDIMPIKTNGQIYYSKIEYNYDSKELAIYIDTLETLEAPLVILPNIDLSKLLDLDTEEYAWVGFTSATGIVYEQHELLSWNFCPVPTSTKIIGVENSKNNLGNKINIYPNPTSGILNVSLSDIDTKNTAVEIYDIMGERLLSKNMNGKSLIYLNLDNYPLGTYCIKIFTGSQVFSKMFIKN